MLPLLEAEIKVFISIHIIMHWQDIYRVGPDLVLAFKIIDHDFHQKIGSLTKVLPEENFWYEADFVFLLGFRWLFVTLRGPYDCCVRYLSKIEMWEYY